MPTQTPQTDAPGPTAVRTSSRLRVKPDDVTFRYKGQDLARTIEKSSITQAELARICGYKGSARVSHLCADGERRIAGQTLRPIVEALRSAGVDVSEFDIALAGARVTA